MARHAGASSCFSDAALAAAATRWSRESSTSDIARATSPSELEVALAELARDEHVLDVGHVRATA